MMIYYAANATNDYGADIHKVVVATKNEGGLANTYDIVVSSEDVDPVVRGYPNQLVVDNGLVRGKNSVELEQDRQERLKTQIRSVRNRMIEESDKYVLPDYPLTSSNTDVTTFRQTLRDLPVSVDLANTATINDVTFPVDPEGEITPMLDMV